MNFVSKELRDRVVGEVDLQIIAESLGIFEKWTNIGKGQFIMHCPSSTHTDNNASCQGSTTRRCWHCFACNAHGNVIDMIMEVKACTFTEAVQYAADVSGISIPEDKKGVQRKNTIPFLTREEQEYIGFYDSPVSKLYDAQYYDDDENNLAGTKKKGSMLLDLMENDPEIYRDMIKNRLQDAMLLWRKAKIKAKCFQLNYQEENERLLGENMLDEAQKKIEFGEHMCKKFAFAIDKNKWQTGSTPLFL